MSDDLHVAMTKLHRSIQQAQYRKDHPRMSKIKNVLGVTAGIGGGLLGCLLYVAIVLAGLAISVGVPVAVGFAALKYLGWI